MRTIHTQKTRTFAFQISLRMWPSTLAALLVCTFSFAQNTSRVWVTVNDPSIIHSSPASPFDELMEQQSVSTVLKAFPNARSSALQNVYELSCQCDNAELEKQLLNVQGVSQPVAVYDPVMLSTPDDYNLTFTPDYALDLIRAQAAWEYSRGNPSVMLAISDVDFDVTHEELAGKILYGGSTGSGSVYHGTAVAVTAAGKTNNNLGKSSIGYNCSLGLFISNYNALLSARDHGARVVNASWHDGACAPNPYCQAVIDELYNSGVTVIAAAGNGAVTCGNAGALAYPASYNHVISVTSIGPNSNHERTPGDPATAHQHNSQVDISAPGYDVPLTVASGWYLTGNGSSFAAPFVTGTVGLMLAANPTLTVDQIENILKTTAVNINELNPGYAGLIGAGRLNAEAAVALSSSLARPHPPTPVTTVQLHEGTIEAADSLAIAGISDIEFVQPVIYPNPSAGDITIAYPFKKGQSVEIYDLTGRLEQIIEVPAGEKAVLPEHLAAGAYSVILKENGQPFFQQRVIVL